MSDIQRLHGNGRLSKATIHNGMVYLTGQIAEDNVGKGMADQTAEVLRRIDALLAEAGTDKSRIVKAFLYVTDMGRFAEVNAAWDAWVSPGNEPARTTIRADLTAPGFDIEITVFAAI